MFTYIYIRGVVQQRIQYGLSRGRIGLMLLVWISPGPPYWAI